jgi:hypothetical protein
MPIILNISKCGFKPPSPLKLNQDWLEESGYRKLISNEWVHLVDILGFSFRKQMTKNLEKIIYRFLGLGPMISIEKTSLFFGRLKVGWRTC